MSSNRLENIVWRLGRLRQLWNGKGVDAPFSDPLAWQTISGAHPNTGRKPANKSEYIDRFTSWVYICGKLNAMSCASVPLELYAASTEKGKRWKTITTRRAQHKRLREIRSTQSLRRYVRKAEEVDEVTDHAFLELMRQVNPFFNASDLMELTILDMDLAGEAYWYIVRGKAGQPVELWPVPSVYMRPEPGKTLSRYIDHYVYQKGRVEVELSTDEVIRFAYPNPRNYIQGMSCVRGVVDAVYTNTHMNEYEEALFANKARTGGVMESDAAIVPEEVARLREEINMRYSGTSNSGRPFIMPPGLKWVKDTMTNEEMSFIEGRKLTREEICAGFDIPVALLDPEAIRANVDGAQYHHAKFGIAPRLRKIEEKLNEKLLPMFDDSGTLFCAFENPVPDDVELELKTRTGYVSGSIMAINEARAELGLDAIEAEEADMPLVPFSVRPIGEERPAPVLLPGAGGGGEDEGNDDEGAEDDLADDAEKLADLTLAKLKERLGVK